jgi:hypothetical protein
MVDDAMSGRLGAADALFPGFFRCSSLAPLGRARRSRRAAGRCGVTNNNAYCASVSTIRWRMTWPDHQDLKNAQVILVGVSRSGKTPTALYLALQFGIKAANFPLTPDDFGDGKLPQSLRPFRHKLFGLTIKPDRLTRIRSERRPESTYASLANCQFEVREAETMMQREGIPALDTTTRSIEEIATTIVHHAKLQRHLF